MNAFDLVFEVVSDLVSFGMTMDGEEYFAPSFYVVATSPYGERWAHEHVFPGAKVVDTPNCERFHVDLSTEAEAAATRLRNRIQGSPNFLHWDRWSKIHAVYGSAAHDERELIAFESEVA